MMKETVTDCPVRGWKRIVCQRKTGKTAGKFDVYFVNPDGKRFRSRREVPRYLKKNDSNLSPELFSFKACKKMDAGEFTEVKERTGVEQGPVQSIYFIDARGEEEAVPGTDTGKSSCCVNKVR
jgi:hypothetical protein